MLEYNSVNGALAVIMSVKERKCVYTYIHFTSNKNHVNSYQSETEAEREREREH